MKRIGIVIAGLAATLAPVAVAQDRASGGDGRVVRARFEVTAEAPRTATVSAAVEMTGGAALDLLVVWFDGQRLEDLRVTDDDGGVPVALTVGPGSLARIVVPAGTRDRRSLYVEYRIEVPSARRYRYPLPVPESSPAPGAEITVEVLLPADTAYHGDGFPALTAAGERDGRPLLRARGAGVPAFVHVVHGAEAGWPALPARIELVVVLLVFLPLGALGARAARRSRGTAR